MIGGAWNGHGLEIGFEASATNTLLITSAECIENNTEVSDALRVGIGIYEIDLASDTECR